jgi:hypothetical protein
VAVSKKAYKDNLRIRNPPCRANLANETVATALLLGMTRSKGNIGMWRKKVLGVLGLNLIGKAPYAGPVIGKHFPIEE